MNASPSERGWQLLQEMERAYFDNQFDKASALANMVSAYQRIPVDNIDDLLVAWFSAANTGTAQQIAFTAQTVTGAAVPTDAEVVWDFGDGAITVSNKSLSSNVATITTNAPHKLLVGAKALVAIGDAVFDGVQTITAVTSNTFSFAKTNANVTAAAAAGTVKPAGLTHTHPYAANGTYFVKVTVDTATLAPVTYGRNVPVPLTS